MIKYRTEHRKRQTLEKRQPCVDTGVLAKARCSKDKELARDKVSFFYTSQL